MRKLLLMSTVAVLGLALPAMAADVSSTMSPPAPSMGNMGPQSTNSLPSGAGTAVGHTPGGAIGSTGAMPMGAQPGMTAGAGDQGDMTGMQPMRRPHGARMAHHGRMHHHGQAADAMGENGARPGHEPGVGDSEPMSGHASNIDRMDTRGDIAPRLPNPNASSQTAEGYLAAADRALGHRQSGAAQEALERAETRMLDRSVPQGQGNAPDQDPRIASINSALQALGNRDYSAARQSIRQAMNMSGGSGMGQGGMSQDGMGQGGMGQGGMQPGMNGGQMPGMAPRTGAGMPR